MTQIQPGIQYLQKGKIQNSKTANDVITTNKIDFRVIFLINFIITKSKSKLVMSFSFS